MRCATPSSAIRSNCPSGSTPCWQTRARRSPSAIRCGFLFILDNLDRYTPEQIDTAVLKHAELYNSVDAHIIFVVPISLLYNPPGETVEDRFQTDNLPMLPVFQRAFPHDLNADTCAEIVAAVHRRVEPGLFATTASVDDMARLSGGCPRDLLRLLQEALLETTDERVAPASVQRAANRVRSEFARKLTYSQYTVLAQAHLDGSIDPNETGRFLLFRRAALEYVDDAGESWIGVHPLLWDAPEFKAALEAEQRRRQEAAR